MRTTSLYPGALVSPFCLEVRPAGARWGRGALLVPLTPVSEAQSVPLVYPLRAGAESEAPSSAATAGAARAHRRAHRDQLSQKRVVGVGDVEVAAVEGAVVQAHDDVERSRVDGRHHGLRLGRRLRFRLAALTVCDPEAARLNA